MFLIGFFQIISFKFSLLPLTYDNNPIHDILISHIKKFTDHVIKEVFVNAFKMKTQPCDDVF